MKEKNLFKIYKLIQIKPSQITEKNYKCYIMIYKKVNKIVIKTNIKPKEDLKC